MEMSARLDERGGRCNMCQRVLTVVVIDLRGADQIRILLQTGYRTHVNQVAQLQVACKAGSFACDTLHETAVTGEDCT